MPAANASDVLAAAQSIAATVAAAGTQIERERAIPSPIVEQLIDHGMFKLLLPAELGGSDLDLHDFRAVVAAFGLADASVAWCINQNNIFATNCVRVDAATRRQIWGDPRSVVTNGPPSADTRAERGADGYVLTGSWNFSSGIAHANWVAALSPAFEPGADKPFAMLHFLIPKSQVDIVDNWNVGGLRGTGSMGFAARELRIPAERTFDLNAAPIAPSRYTTISTTPLFATGFATVALATARSALRAAIETATKKKPQGSQRELRHEPTTQRAVAQAHAIIEAASAYLDAAVARLWDASADLNPLRPDERIEARLAGTHAIREAIRATDIAYELCGSSAIFAEHPVQRKFQDVHAIGQQIQGRLAHYDTVGQHLLGLEPKGLY